MRKGSRGIVYRAQGKSDKAKADLAKATELRRPDNSPVPGD
jgi:hypothetical protein